ncbi:hypothetical protein CAPTEDRAFT_195086, partial [Capitella teleta]
SDVHGLRCYTCLHNQLQENDACVNNATLVDVTTCSANQKYCKVEEIVIPTERGTFGKFNRKCSIECSSDPPSDVHGLRCYTCLHNQLQENDACVNNATLVDVTTCSANQKYCKVEEIVIPTERGTFGKFNRKCSIECSSECSQTEEEQADFRAKRTVEQIFDCWIIIEKHLHQQKDSHHQRSKSGEVVCYRPCCSMHSTELQNYRTKPTTYVVGFVLYFCNTACEVVDGDGIITRNIIHAIWRKWSTFALLLTFVPERSLLHNDASAILMKEYLPEGKDAIV